MKNARKLLLLEIEQIIGSECYNGNIQNWGPGGVFEGEGRDFRYPITFIDVETGEATKRWSPATDLQVKTLMTGQYKFGANSLHVMAGIDKVLKYLETRYGLKID